VRVFEQASRGKNMMLEVLQPEGEEPDLEATVGELLDQEIWVSWPHMTEAKVTEVANEEVAYFIDRNGQQRKSPHDEFRRAAFQANRESVAERYKSRWGVEIGQTHIVVQAAPMTGRKVWSHHMN